MPMTEYDSFKRILDGLKQAEDGAKQMAFHQPDRNRIWQQLAIVYRDCQTVLYKVAEEDAAKKGGRLS